MTREADVKRSLVAKLRELTVEQLTEVEGFVDFLHLRSLQAKPASADDEYAVEVVASSVPADPPPYANRRKHPRFELHAMVQLAAGREALTLSVKNISLGGVYLLSNGYNLGFFAPGSQHKLTMFDPANVGEQVTASAKVVRHKKDGMALVWNEDDVLTIAAVIDKLPPR
jgi:hypothetical protein